MTLLRIQDKDGRGPFKPGFSHKWAVEKAFYLPALQEDFPPGIFTVIDAAHKAGKHIGIAVEANKFDLWFSQSEQASLHQLGYRVVDATNCEVLAKSNWQVLIASKNPLSDLKAAHEEAKEARG